MSAAPPGAKKRKHHEEEHENHERWLVTYADMLTVLMALFIVMFAISVVDKNKFEALKSGFQDHFGNGPTLLDGGQGLLDGQPPATDMAQDVEAAIAALNSQRSTAAAVAAERDALEAVKRKIDKALTEKGLADKVRYEIDERGLIVTLVTDEVLFDLGSASLRDGGKAVLDAIGPALVPLANPVTIEGHTDDLPISGGRFPSNWELSAERATSVLRYVLDTHKLSPKRLSAAGYADQRPLVPNTPDKRQVNRRVEVIVRAIAATSQVVPAAKAAPAPLPVAPKPATDMPAQTAHADQEKH